MKLSVPSLLLKSTLLASTRVLASTSVLASSTLLASTVLTLAGCEATPNHVCGAGERRKNGECVEVPSISVDTVGYLPKRTKIATFVDEGDAAFEVKNLDGDTVFKGTASDAVVDPDTTESLRQADFSDFQKPGRYYIEVGPRHSPQFSIGDDVYEAPLTTAMLGLTGQRCGVEVDIQTESGHFHHPACHTAEASLSTIKGQSGTKDDTGGWHDAGDYGKYTNNGAFAVAFLLKAYEHYPERMKSAKFELPESDNDTPDILDEARVEVEWLLKTQLEDGSAAHKVTAKAFEGMIMPNADVQPRFFVPIGTVATADLAAVAALAARLYEPFDAKFSAKCLAAAQKAYAFLQEHPDLIEPDQTGFTTGGYNNGADRDERLWAAAELFETTGDADVLAAFNEAAKGSERIETSFDWPNAGNLAFTTYLFSTREGRDQEIVDAIADSVRSAADMLLSNASKSAYGRALGSYYNWGVNGTLARTAFNLAAAYRLDADEKYLNGISLQLDHLFGRNPYVRSYVTAVGYDSPQAPHHRPSQADDQVNPWPGLLVGGPHAGGASEGTPAAMAWSDSAEDYFHNEIAINWNTALVYALVAAE